jgi:hypothetical protein
VIKARIARPGTAQDSITEATLTAHRLYRVLGFTPEAEGFRLYPDP